MREIVADTETTGLDPFSDKLIEIGCVELENLVPTGRTFHTYINPLHQVSSGAFKIHGISNDFLADKPYFGEVIDDLIDFIGDDPLVIHNATFDLQFLNQELKRIKRPPLTNPIVDTLALARKVKPGGRHNLDALCSHFDIDTTKRVKHGALLDSEILAEVYLALRGGRQFGFALPVQKKKTVEVVVVEAKRRELASFLTDDELNSHDEFMGGIKGSIWSTYRVEQKSEAA